jgi:hypothetical protein
MTADGFTKLAILNAEAADFLQPISPAAARVLRNASGLAAAAAKLESAADAVA